MKRVISLILTTSILLSLLYVPAGAASTPEEALGNIKIISGGYSMQYLAVNGRVQKQEYTYFNSFNQDTGERREIPAYCINPNQYGVPQTVEPGESIEYLAEEAASDPKIVGLVANMYPHRDLGELGLENRQQAFYAGKIALWCHLIPSWDISKVTVNPNLTGDEKARAERILAATIDIYTRGMTWASIRKPSITTTLDKDAAYPVTIDGKDYLQQVFTLHSNTWVTNEAVNITYTYPDDAALADVEALAPAKALYEDGLSGMEHEFARYMDAVRTLEGMPVEPLLAEKTEVYGQLAELNRAIRETRTKLALCREILDRTPQMEQTLRKIESRENEVRENEHRRR